jgi:hypothetical protein
MARGHLDRTQGRTPTKAAFVRKVLANSEPSTRGRFCCKTIFGGLSEQYFAAA